MKLVVGLIVVELVWVKAERHIIIIYSNSFIDNYNVMSLISGHIGFTIIYKRSLADEVPERDVTYLICLLIYH